VTRSLFKYAVVILALTCLLAADGCARIRGRAADERSTAPVSAEVDGGFKLVWAVVRDVLRDSPVELYTRDKRGTFEVFEDRGRRFLTPRRLRLVITLRPISESRTRVDVETFPEAYTVQLLTTPAWRPADFGDNSLAQEIIDSIQQRIREGRG
jgi:hypothetical protein